MSNKEKSLVHDLTNAFGRANLVIDSLADNVSVNDKEGLNKDLSVLESICIKGQEVINKYKKEVLEEGK